MTCRSSSSTTAVSYHPGPQRLAGQGMAGRTCPLLHSHRATAPPSLARPGPHRRGRPAPRRPHPPRPPTHGLRPRHRAGRQPDSPRRRLWTTLRRGDRHVSSRGRTGRHRRHERGDNCVSQTVPTSFGRNRYCSTPPPSTARRPRRGSRSSPSPASPSPTSSISRPPWTPPALTPSAGPACATSSESRSATSWAEHGLHRLVRTATKARRAHTTPPGHARAWPTLWRDRRPAAPAHPHSRCEIHEESLPCRGCAADAMAAT
jgi:hypothetical protein